MENIQNSFLQMAFFFNGRTIMTISDNAFGISKEVLWCTKRCSELAYFDNA